MTAAFEVIHAGSMATVQDLGRTGYQRFGMPVAGAMDPFALQAANLLAGNPRDLAAIEIPLGGVVLRALAEQIIAVTGADLGATIDGETLQRWKSLRVRRGQEITWRAPVQGAWAYLAVAGGIEVPPFMGSRATYLRAKIGGLAGRSIQRGDLLHAGAPPPSSIEGRSIPQSMIPPYPDKVTVNVVLGPHHDRFQPEAIKTLLSARFTVSPRSDRMGYRLQGPPLPHSDPTDLLSEAVTAGTIQVPPGAQPIVLMADRQTTGGYPQIATVISINVPLVAQLRPGNELSFKQINIEHAQDLTIKQEQSLSLLRAACGVK